jgi:thiol-disulfide isomerase/thioredoxin
VFSRPRLILAAIVVLIALGIIAAPRLPRFARVPSEGATQVAQVDVVEALRVGSGWLNGDRTVLDSLKGSPAVIAVWSDTDPRCLEQLPRVEGWHQAYRRYGVHVIGVYAPDFSFGVDSTVPMRVVQRMGLAFPIVLDPSYLARSRLAPIAREKPILVIGPDGRAIATADFDRSEQVDHILRDELRRARPDLDFPTESAPPPAGPSREIQIVHLGVGRISAGPLASAHAGRTEVFTTQFRFQEEGGPCVPFPVGRWTATAEGVIAARGGAADFVSIKNPGDRAFAVMSPRHSGTSRVWILAEQAWMPPAERGADVRADGRGATYVDVTEPRLYEIAKAGKERVLRLSPEEPGLTMHAFVFEKIE